MVAAELTAQHHGHSASATISCAEQRTTATPDDGGRADQASHLQDGLELANLADSLYSLCIIYAAELHVVISRQV